MIRDPHRLRVASYNVRAFKDDRAALREVVRTIDPDLLFLQEAPRHPLSDSRIGSFAASVKMTWSGGKRGWMSTTMLTGLRVGVHSAVHRNLPVRRGDEPRGYAIAMVSLPGHSPLTAASLHMTLRGAERGPHAQLVLGELRRAGLPAVIGGDLNETPGNVVWRTFAPDLRPVSADEPTFPAKAPVKRIDAIFASPSLPATVPQLEIDPALFGRATDHRPIVVDLDLSALAR
ncbi:hypothetical protein G9U51_09150 [Calidifontibacter sp. DB0510]|uniref:Endonuclease/exonuclease/phosphatase domain-containing protein n=1 Tax=Metallococcus carri TaxID=1656884 RepID=A0A967B212_9MICO|nr:endonuclease/exonuclease/phosphatase family protein [Metallococcus carri]NHN55940.1 hypothetical protein [Metallococcus carri]NOP37603.1 hypothetical protein [Calidifontibacter sp. DB2511S]